jgi:lipopolysaccharide/colanic/teichoic acid biosynthesis glycosyltransferase
VFGHVSLVRPRGSLRSECKGDDAEWEQTFKLSDHPHVTGVGRLLHHTSLDELPQLWNVLLGEMSLVGPRPIVDAEIPKYGAVYEMYRRIRPGISGLWQISGRSDMDYAERVELDAYYVHNWSVWLDLVILVRTVWIVMMRRGAY